MVSESKNSKTTPTSEAPVVWASSLQPRHAGIQLSAADNVAVALRQINAGETLAEFDNLLVRDEIPKGHKLSLAPVASGEKVTKYAQIIGLASEAIEPGCHVHSHNLAFRQTDHEYEFSVDLRDMPAPQADAVATFEGYHRGNGVTGTRNYLAVLSSVNCSATVARHIADSITAEELAAFDNVDGVVAFTHATGCGMADVGDGFDNLHRVLIGYATHPNVAGVLMVGLGCEVNQIQDFVSRFGVERGALFKTMNIQSTGGHRKTVEIGAQLIRDMLPLANQSQRETRPASELMLALQCGGSDAWSGITANPALGYAVDLLVQQGGTGVLAETPEVYGAEHLLTRRAVDEATGKKLVDRILWWEEYVAKHQGSMDNNPSPGNKLGGLTTILEKSLGAVAKGGTTTLNGVYRYAEKVDRNGFVFMDSPGYDPASITGEVAGGCNLVAFTTGRGSTYGCKPAPSIKIATNTEMYKRMSDDMDINAGKIVSEGASVEEVGREIFELLLAIASGQRSLSEQCGLGDNEFIPWQIGATM